MENRIKSTPALENKLNRRFFKLPLFETTVPYYYWIGSRPIRSQLEAPNVPRFVPDAKLSIRSLEVPAAAAADRSLSI